MSQDPSAILAYGYDLGGDESGWNLEGVEQYSDFEFDEDDLLEKLLLKIVGFDAKTFATNSASDRQILNEARKEAETAIGVEFVRYSSFDFPAWILATVSYKSPDWGSMVVPNNLRAKFFTDSQVKLASALRVLGFKPTQAEPRWILASFYG